MTLFLDQRKQEEKKEQEVLDQQRNQKLIEQPCKKDAEMICKSIQLFPSALEEGK